MTSRERLSCALNHQEPDRIPLDLGSMPFSGITKVAYRGYTSHLGLDVPEPGTADVKQQLAVVDPAVLEHLGVDTRPVRRGRSAKQTDQLQQQPGYEFFIDEWDLGWRRPLPDGLYYDLFKHPLRGLDLSQIKAWEWPDPTSPSRFEGMGDELAAGWTGGHGLVMGGFCAGVWEMCLWLRSYDQFLYDMAAEPALADWMLGKLVDLKLAYWERAFAVAGNRITACYEADDLAGQDGYIISPTMYRSLVKPHQVRLFKGLRALCGDAKIVYHTDGAIFELIRDLLDLEIDALNPIQVSAAGMGDTAKLKATYGQDLCFWGSACDTQHTLPHGTPEQVREETKRRIGDLAPGGGYVFSTVHNIQADVPPENLAAMYETFAEEAGY